MDETLDQQETPAPTETQEPMETLETWGRTVMERPLETPAQQVQQAMLAAMELAEAQATPEMTEQLERTVRQEALERQEQEEIPDLAAQQEARSLLMGSSRSMAALAEPGALEAMVASAGRADLQGEQETLVIPEQQETPE